MDCCLASELTVGKVWAHGAIEVDSLLCLLPKMQASRYEVDLVSHVSYLVLRIHEDRAQTCVVSV